MKSAAVGREPDLFDRGAAILPLRAMNSAAVFTLKTMEAAAAITL